VRELLAEADGPPELVGQRETRRRVAYVEARRGTAGRELPICCVEYRSDRCRRGGGGLGKRGS
jgi:hypothetical protein